MRSVHTSKISRYSVMPRSCSSPRSWPEENAGPFAARTMARTSGDLPKTSRQEISSRINSSERAFLRSGRFRVTTATEVTASTSKKLYSDLGCDFILDLSRKPLSAPYNANRIMAPLNPDFESRELLGAKLNHHRSSSV